MNLPSGDSSGAKPPRDGRWIYFDSIRTGEQQVWKIPEAGGDAIQVTRDDKIALQNNYI